MVALPEPPDSTDTWPGPVMPTAVTLRAAALAPPAGTPGRAARRTGVFESAPGLRRVVRVSTTRAGSTGTNSPALLRGADASVT